MPSGYLRVSSPTKQRKGIVRPGAINLRLPLVERHFQSNDGSAENLLTLGSSQWTISAAPITSASLYSQASYTMSPPVFHENKLDRRRFGIAKTPAQEGPWSRPERLQSATSSVFVLDLKSPTTDNTDPFIGKGEGDDQGDMEKGLLGNTTVVGIEAVPEMIHTTSKEATNARIKKLRMSTRVLGKMLTRLSVHRSSSRPSDVDKAPLLPSMPPQILISLPSPRIELPSPSKEDTKQDMVIEDGLHPFVVEKKACIPHKYRPRPSTWKPHRPPSPLPRSLRRHGKCKSDAPALPQLGITSPPPPLPTRPKITSTVIDPNPTFFSFSTPLDRVLSKGPTSPVWDDIQMRLRARAMKSSTYAIHDGGIISPTSF